MNQRQRPRIARRMGEIAPFQVMELLVRARAMEADGRDIVHMEIGEPDFDTPGPVVRAAHAALERGDIHYTPAMGLLELREAISGWYRTRYAVEVPPHRICVTPGASGALLLACGVLLDPGDRVLMADPGYPCNRHFVRFCEGEPVGVPVDARTAWQLTPEMVGARWSRRTVAALLASPSNPTGTVVPPEGMAAILDRVRAGGGTLIVDEIYHGLSYGFRAGTALALSDDVFVVNSFSKYFGMTGWRLGWLVVPAGYVREVEKLGQNLFISASTIAQRAALSAFTPENLAILESRRGEFQRRRDYLLPALARLGFELPVTPRGAFYLYADCGRLTTDSHRFALEVLEKAGVAITPGTDFGRHQPERHVRFAYTTSMERLEEGVDRLGRYLGH